MIRLQTQKNALISHVRAHTQLVANLEQVKTLQSLPKEQKQDFDFLGKHYSSSHEKLATSYNERSETIDAVINLNLVTTHICLYLAVTLSQNLTFSGLKNIQIDKRNHTKTYSLLQFRRMRLAHG